MGILGMRGILQPYSDDVLIYNTDVEISSYLSKLNAIKEFIINSWDADADKIKISVDSEKIIFEDWGTGIEDLRLFWSIGNQQKSSQKLTPRFGRKPIGCRGLGKLSYVRLGEKIFVETRTKDKAENTTVDYKRMKFHVKPQIKKSVMLSHKGTRLTITELNKPIDKDEVVTYIKEELYGLILPIASKKNVIQIFVNDEKVKPEVPHGKDKILINHFGNIQCSLYPASVSKIDILYRGIKICEIDPEDNLNAIGYVNVDWLNFISDEYKIADTEEGHLFLSEIKNWIQNKMTIPETSELGR